MKNLVNNTFFVNEKELENTHLICKITIDKSNASQNSSKVEEATKARNQIEKIKKDTSAKLGGLSGNIFTNLKTKVKDFVDSNAESYKKDGYEISRELGEKLKIKHNGKEFNAIVNGKNLQYLSVNGQIIRTAGWGSEKLIIDKDGKSGGGDIEITVENNKIQKAEAENWKNEFAEGDANGKAEDMKMKYQSGKATEYHIDNSAENRDFVVKIFAENVKSDVQNVINISSNKETTTNVKQKYSTIDPDEKNILQKALETNYSDGALGRLVDLRIITKADFPKFAGEENREKKDLAENLYFEYKKGTIGTKQLLPLIKEIKDIQISKADKPKYATKLEKAKKEFEIINEIIPENKEEQIINCIEKETAELRKNPSKASEIKNSREFLANKIKFEIISEDTENKEAEQKMLEKIVKGKTKKRYLQIDASVEKFHKTKNKCIDIALANNNETKYNEGSKIANTAAKKFYDIIDESLSALEKDLKNPATSIKYKNEKEIAKKVNLKISNHFADKKSKKLNKESQLSVQKAQKRNEQFWNKTDSKAPKNLQIRRDKLLENLAEYNLNINKNSREKISRDIDIWKENFGEGNYTKIDTALKHELEKVKENPFADNKWEDIKKSIINRANITDKDSKNLLEIFLADKTRNVENSYLVKKKIELKNLVENKKTIKIENVSESLKSSIALAVNSREKAIEAYTPEKAASMSWLDISTQSNEKNINEKKELVLEIYKTLNSNSTNQNATELENIENFIDRGRKTSGLERTNNRIAKIRSHAKKVAQERQFLVGGDVNEYHKILKLLEINHNKNIDTIIRENTSDSTTTRTIKNEETARKLKNLYAISTARNAKDTPLKKELYKLKIKNDKTVERLSINPDTVERSISIISKERKDLCTSPTREFLATSWTRDQAKNKLINRLKESNLAEQDVEKIVNLIKGTKPVEGLTRQNSPLANTIRDYNEVLAKTEMERKAFADPKYKQLLRILDEEISDPGVSSQKIINEKLKQNQFTESEIKALNRVYDNVGRSSVNLSPLEQRIWELKKSGDIVNSREISKNNYEYAVNIINDKINEIRSPYISKEILASSWDGPRGVKNIIINDVKGTYGENFETKIINDVIEGNYSGAGEMEILSHEVSKLRGFVTQIESERKQFGGIENYVKIYDFKIAIQEDPTIIAPQNIKIENETLTFTKYKNLDIQVPSMVTPELLKQQPEIITKIISNYGKGVNVVKTQSGIAILSDKQNTQLANYISNIEIATDDVNAMKLHTYKGKGIEIVSDGYSRENFDKIANYIHTISIASPEFRRAGEEFVFAEGIKIVATPLGGNSGNSSEIFNRINIHAENLDVPNQDFKIIISSPKSNYEFGNWKIKLNSNDKVTFVRPQKIIIKDTTRPDVDNNINDNNYGNEYGYEIINQGPKYYQIGNPDRLGDIVKDAFAGDINFSWNLPVEYRVQNLDIARWNKATKAYANNNPKTRLQVAQATRAVTGNPNPDAGKNINTSKPFLMPEDALTNGCKLRQANYIRPGDYVWIENGKVIVSDTPPKSTTITSTVQVSEDGQKVNKVETPKESKEKETILDKVKKGGENLAKKVKDAVTPEKKVEIKNVKEIKNQIGLDEEDWNDIRTISRTELEEFKNGGFSSWIKMFSKIGFDTMKLSEWIKSEKGDKFFNSGLNNLDEFNKNRNKTLSPAEKQLRETKNSWWLNNLGEVPKNPENNSQQNLTKAGIPTEMFRVLPGENNEDKYIFIKQQKGLWDGTKLLPAFKNIFSNSDLQSFWGEYKLTAEDCNAFYQKLDKGYLIPSWGTKIDKTSTSISKSEGTSDMDEYYSISNEKLITKANRDAGTAVFEVNGSHFLDDYRFDSIEAMFLWLKN